MYYIKNVTVDCGDVLTMARFWAAVLGSNVDEDATAERAYVEAAGWGGPNMWFVKVPEPKTAKNRMHFDLRAPGPMRVEIARLTELGATVVRRGDDLTVRGCWQTPGRAVARSRFGLARRTDRVIPVPYVKVRPTQPGRIWARHSRAGVCQQPLMTDPEGNEFCVE